MHVPGMTSHRANRIMGMAGIAVAVVVMFGIGGLQLHAHEQNIARLQASYDADARDVEAYQRVSERTASAAAAFKKSVDAFISATQSFSGFGSLAVMKEKLDAIKSDRTLDDALAFSRQHVPSDSRTMVQRDAAVILSQEADHRDRITDISSTFGMVISNPIYAMGMSGEDFRKKGYDLGSSLAKTRRAIRALRTDLEKAQNRARARKQRGQIRLRQAKSEPWLSAIWHP